MRWKQFKAKWENCNACEFHKRRRKIVLAKGKIPCDILFCGEAPGKGEDSTGIPFVGEAGTRILGPILEKSFDGYQHIKAAYTNILACIPKIEVEHPVFSTSIVRKVATGKEVPKECIQSCSARLDDFVELCKPKAIVWVGGLAAKYGPRVGIEELPQVHITHPAAIIRANIANQGHAMQQCVAKIRSLLFDLHEEYYAYGEME